MNNGKVLKHFTIVGLGTLLNLLLGLFTTPLITRMVDPIEYGQLSIFIMYSNIAVMVLCIGLDQALVRFYYENDTIEYKRELLFKCIKYPVVISCLISVIIALTSYLNVINYEFSTFIMILLCIYSITELLYRFSILLVRLNYKSKLFSSLNILKKLIYVIIALILLTVINDFDIYILTISTFVAAFLCMIISVIAQSNNWNFRFIKTELVDERKLYKYAYPFILTSGITTLFQAIDKIFLNYFCSYTEVGIYSSTMTLVHVFAIIQTTFNTLWSPMSIEHYTKKPNDKEYYKKANHLITCIMFFLGISLILCKDLFAYLLGEKYREAAYILPFLIFNPIMYTISETTVMGLVFKKKSNVQIFVALGACITNIVGNYFLVPLLGPKGAAISTGISYIVFFSIRTFLSNRYYYINFELKKFYILTAIVSLFALYNTFFKFSAYTILGYIVCLFVLICFYKKTILWIIDYLESMLKHSLRSKE